jgi:hypothetical protein
MLVPTRHGRTWVVSTGDKSAPVGAENDVRPGHGSGTDRAARLAASAFVDPRRCLAVLLRQARLAVTGRRLRSAAGQGRLRLDRHQVVRSHANPVTTPRIHLHSGASSTAAQGHGQPTQPCGQPAPPSRRNEHRESLTPQRPQHRPAPETPRCQANRDQLTADRDFAGALPAAWWNASTISCAPRSAIAQGRAEASSAGSAAGPVVAGRPVRRRRKWIAMPAATAMRLLAAMRASAWPELPPVSGHPG